MPKNEFDKFNSTMEQLVKVPHAEIRAKLDAEKAAKQRKSKPRRKAPRNNG